MERLRAEQVYRGNIDQLLKKINKDGGIALQPYRRAYVERRITARMRMLRLHSYRQYASHLTSHPDEYAKLMDTLTINVTDFFRDPVVYEAFNTKILPSLIEDKIRSRNRIVRVWSAGCATGEEPYSLAMSFMEALRNKDANLNFTIFGTDLDPNALATAKQATYATAKLSHIPKRLQVKYLQVDGDRFQINPEVKKHVKFRQMNLFTDKPVSMVDVIFCRNVFIYFDKEQQEKVLKSFWSALSRGGYLVLGRSEKMSASMTSEFLLVNGKERIYRKPSNF